MRIGILSDTHDRVQRTAAAVQRLTAEGIDALIHCGDLTGPDVVHECHTTVPTYFVFGNNDYQMTALRRAMTEIGATCLEHGGLVQLGKWQVGVTHGDSLRELRRLADLGPDYLLSGHTHVACDDRHGTIRRINPGALDRASTWTVALLDLGTDDLRFLTISDPSRRRSHQDS